MNICKTCYFNNLVITKRIWSMCNLRQENKIGTFILILSLTYFHLHFRFITTINITYKYIYKYLKHTFSFDNLVAKLPATYFMQPSVESRKRTVDLNSIVVSAAVISPQQTLAQQCTDHLHKELSTTNPFITNWCRHFDHPWKLLPTGYKPASQHIQSPLTPRLTGKATSFIPTIRHCWFTTSDPHR